LSARQPCIRHGTHRENSRNAPMHARRQGHISQDCTARFDASVGGPLHQQHRKCVVRTLKAITTIKIYGEVHLPKAPLEWVSCHSACTSEKQKIYRHDLGKSIYNTQSPSAEGTKVSQQQENIRFPNKKHEFTYMSGGHGVVRTTAPHQQSKLVDGTRVGTRKWMIKQHTCFRTFAVRHSFAYRAPGLN